MSIIREIELPIQSPSKCTQTPVSYGYIFFRFCRSRSEVWGLALEWFPYKHFAFVRMNSLFHPLFIRYFILYALSRFLSSARLKNYLLESQVSSVPGLKRRLQIVRRSHYANHPHPHLHPHPHPSPVASADMCNSIETGCSSWSVRWGWVAGVASHGTFIHSKNWKIYFLVLCDYIFSS